jgi:hypothetical protein
MRLFRFTLAALAAASCISAAPASAAVTLFEDKFQSFALGTDWIVPRFAFCSQATGTNICKPALGAPNVRRGVTPKGLRLTSAQTTYQFRAISTAHSFALSRGSVIVDFRTGESSDPSLKLPAGTIDQNIDGVVGVELIDPVTKNYFAAGVFGGEWGSSRWFYVNSSIGLPSYSSPPDGPDNDWQYGQAYRIEFVSTLASTNVLFEDALGNVLWSQSLPQSLDYLPKFRVVVFQRMGTPGATYYNDAFVNRVKVVQR